MGRIIYIHGPVRWVAWATILIESAGKRSSLDLRVVTSLEQSAAADFTADADSDSFAIILVGQIRGEISRRIADGGQGFREVAQEEVAKAVWAYELTRRIPNIVIDLAQVGSEQDLVDRILNAILGTSPTGMSRHPLPIVLEHGTLSPELDQIVDGCLEPLYAAIRDTHLPTIHWPRDLFFSGDAPGTVLPPVIEVAGGPRILSYGPYLVLPCGPWKIDVTMGFSTDIQDLPFLIELCSQSVLFRGYFQVIHGGLFSLSFDASVDQAGVPLEIRIISQESSLEGRMSLIEVTFSPSVAERDTSSSPAA